MACTDAASVFIVVPIDDVVTAILDRPMAAVNVEYALGISLFGRSACNAISNFARALSSLLLYSMSFNEEDLSNMRKVKVVVKLGAGPDLSGFDSSMIGGRMLNKIRFLPVLEQQGDIFENAALVSFDGEMIMGMTFRNQVLGNLTLG